MYKGNGCRGFQCFLAFPVYVHGDCRRILLASRIVQVGFLCFRVFTTDAGVFVSDTTQRLQGVCVGIFRSHEGLENSVGDHRKK